MHTPIVWLASYPRSGNTFARTIIFHSLGVRTASIYRKDLGEGRAPELVGHIEHGPGGRIDYGSEPVRILKTHQAPQSDDYPTIYVLRDGRAATVSLYDFYEGRAPMMDIIEGRTRFGTWKDHVARWMPTTRPATLFLRYEEMVANIPLAIEQLSEFLRLPVKSQTIPSREQIASSDGRWVRSSSDHRSELAGAELDRFMEINGEAMAKFGYV